MRRSNLADARVCIIGLGLMGGSLALALRGHCAAIYGYDSDPATVDLALERGVIDGAIDPGDPIEAIDLVILATPVGAILDWLVQAPFVFPGSFHLLDLGSTKTEIVAAMQLLPDRISPLGGHPMCGKEAAGLSAADCDLFQDRRFVLTPLDRTEATTLALARQLIAAIGAQPFVLEPERHDRLVAAISHVPYLASVALIEAADRLGDWAVWPLTSSGFRDSTRLASSDLTMLLDILTSNRSAVLKSLARLQRSLQELAELIEHEDRSSLRACLEGSRTRRKNMVL
jgi:prephenate dehydrogenase